MGYVNNTCNSTYSGTQCKRKFNSLVAVYNVSKIIIQIIIKIYTNYVLIIQRIRIWSYTARTTQGESGIGQGDYISMNFVPGFGRSRVSIWNFLIQIKIYFNLIIY